MNKHALSSLKPKSSRCHLLMKFEGREASIYDYNILLQYGRAGRKE
jgi:hypothetical protein